MIITVQCDMASPKVYPMKSIAATLPSPLLCHMVVFREDDVLVDDDAGDNEDGDDFEGELCVGREGGGAGWPPGCSVDVHENLASAQHRQTISPAKSSNHRHHHSHCHNHHHNRSVLVTVSCPL